MDARLAEAEIALQAGRRSQAIALLISALEDDPAQPLQIYRVLLNQLYRERRYAEGEAWSAVAVTRFPKNVELWNLRGVNLRRLRRYDEALAAFDTVQKLEPSHPSVLPNKGNIYNDRGDGPAAEKLFTQLVRKFPRNSDFQRQLAVALRRQGKLASAIARLRQALAIDKTNVDAWLDLTGILGESQKDSEALVAIDRAIAQVPSDERLAEAKAIILRRSGHLRAAEAFLQTLLPRLETCSWLQYQLGGVVTEYDRPRGNTHLRKAVELAPGNADYVFALAESLDRTRGVNEPALLEEAYNLVHTVLDLEALDPGQLKVANEIFARICAFDDSERLGTFGDLGRRWAESGKHAALLAHLPRVRTDEDRLDLVEHHRIWGRGVETAARSAPIRRVPRPKSVGKIRLGFMSSDLRHHPVAYFSLPLFEHVDTDRFEVFCYSYFQGEADSVQDYIASRVTAFRWMKDITLRGAAQAIADDNLDMLIELGGSTHMNRLPVMAYRPAERLASWLGYPHSAGLEAIDYLICDPYTAPPRPELLIEKPLMMPKTWLALGRMVFAENHPVPPETPESRTGVITFGTANNPYKYNRETLQTWAQVMLQVPNSRCLFVRPEGGSGIFRRHVTAIFEAQGVAANRIAFQAVRGKHMPHYNEIDISLDTFPLTGGTTTCEALWMGVPVVSLVGEAFFERLSYSILANVGLSDLCVNDKAGFIETAVALANDPARRLDLRRTLRDRIRASPLGKTEAFARDFYDLIASAVAQPAPTRA